jgi:putative phage-type endonuclease
MTARMPIETVVDYGTREAWLAARKSGIGASESAALFGLSPFQSRLSLWLVKTGRVPDWEPTGDAAERLEWGQVLEAPIAEVYQRRTGRKLWRFSSYCIAQDRDLTCMFATPDGFIIEAPDRAARGQPAEGTVQIKNTANVFDPDGWSAGVPMYVQVQVQHELAVTGRDYATVATLAMGNKLLHWDIERNDAFIAELRTQVEMFWESVLSGRQPDADGHPRTLEALKRMHPKDNGCVVDLPSEAAFAWQDLQDAKAIIKTNLKKADQAEAKLRQLMGPNTFGVLPGGLKLSLKTIDNPGGTHTQPPYNYRTLRQTKEPLPLERAPAPPELPPAPPPEPTDDLTKARKTKSKKGKAA